MRILLPLLLLLNTSVFGEEAIRLQFAPNVPVEQTITIDVDMHQNLPGFKMDAVSKQDFKAILKISSEQSEASSLSQGPADLIFTMKDLNVEMKINGKNLVYHAKDAAHSVETAEIAKVIDRPLRLQLNEQFQLKEDNKELKKILEDLPQLKKLNLEKIIKEMFVYLYAFAGKDIRVGNVYPITIPSELIPGLPVTLSYIITKIENDNVYATIAGTINTANKPLKNKLRISDEKEEQVYLNAKGKILGHGQWNVKNALIHHIDTDFDVTGSIKVNNLEWPLSFKGRVNVKSQAVK